MTRPGIPSLLLSATAAATLAAAPAPEETPYVYRPELQPPAAVVEFQDRLEPGSGAFSDEATVRALDLRLAELADRIRESPGRVDEAGPSSWREARLGTRRRRSSAPRSSRGSARWSGTSSGSRPPSC